jgi:FAD binding domain
MAPEKRVFVVGGGPVGLVAAAHLIQSGIPVTLFEATASVSQELRASTFHAPTMDMLDDLGFAKDLLAEGRVAPNMPVQQLSGLPTTAESRSRRIGHIDLEVKQTGERSAGNPLTAFDVAGTGNGARSRCCDTRRRKGEATGNTNIDLNRRASPRPYL